MIHFVIIIDFLTVTLNKKYLRVKQKNPLEVVSPKADFKSFAKIEVYAKPDAPIEPPWLQFLLSNGCKL